MNKKAMNEIIKDLKVEDLGYLVREVLKNKETVYYSNQLEIDAHNKFMMVAYIGPNISPVHQGLNEVNTDVFGSYDDNTKGLEMHCLTRTEETNETPN